MKEVIRKIIEDNLEKSSDAINAQTITKVDMNIIIDTPLSGINPMSIHKGSPVSINDGVLCYTDTSDDTIVYLDMDYIIEVGLLPNGYKRPSFVQDFFEHMMNSKKGE